MVVSSIDEKREPPPHDLSQTPDCEAGPNSLPARAERARKEDHHEYADPCQRVERDEVRREASVQPSRSSGKPFVRHKPSVVVQDEDGSPNGCVWFMATASGRKRCP